MYVLENILVKTYNLFSKKVARPIGEVDILVKDLALRVGGFQVSLS